VVRGYRPLTVREVAGEVGIRIGYCHQICNGKLQMRRVSAKFMPCWLPNDKKENRVEISQELLASEMEMKIFLRTS
jgi:hypothetical protein